VPLSIAPYDDEDEEDGDAAAVILFDDEHGYGTGGVVSHTALDARRD
jgi:hypothetical protein